MWGGPCEPADILKTRSFTTTYVLLQKCLLITYNGLLLHKLTVAQLFNKFVVLLNFQTSKAVYVILFYVLYYMFSLMMTD